jgi:hypothetical protein
MGCKGIVKDKYDTMGWRFGMGRVEIRNDCGFDVHGI